MIAVIAVCGAMCLVGCDEQGVRRGNAMVVYELEGGTYQNSIYPVIHYYHVAEGEQSYLQDPLKLSNKTIERSGYVFTGWFATRTEQDGKVTYGDPWNFATDRIDQEGITLYAGWEVKAEYFYHVCYIDEQGERVVLGTYDVKAGDVFNDYMGYADRRVGYTALRITDKDGNEWNRDYAHPTDQIDVDVYVQYVEGDYRLVSTKSELRQAKSDNIYLLNDIDMGGANFSFGDYKGIIQGNGHTISNFSLSYSDLNDDLIADPLDNSKRSLAISLLGKANGAELHNVTFENVSVKLSTANPRIDHIYIAPISVNAASLTLDNVHMDLTITIAKLPSGWTTTDGRLQIAPDGQPALVFGGEAPALTGDNSFVVTVTEGK